MKNIGASMKVHSARRMKCAVVSALISLAFVSQAFAVLRPLFPAKTAPPFNGEIIVTENDLVCQRKSKSHASSLGIGFSKSNRNVSLSAFKGTEDKPHGMQRD
jgi:hypothetical protein